MADATPAVGDPKTGPEVGLGPRVKRLALALAVHLAVALFLFQKAVFYKGPRVIGADDTEVYPFLWGFFWVKESILEDHALPYATDLMDFPLGGVLWVKEQLTGILLLPLQLLFDIPAAYTAAQILHSVVGGMGIFLALRLLKAPAAAATLAGLTYAFCPHQLGEAYNGNLDAMNIGWSALWVASLMGVIRAPGLGRVLGAGFCLMGLLVSNQYYAIALGVASVPVAALALYDARASGLARPTLRILGALALGLALAVPLGSTLKDSLKAPNKLHDFGSPATDTPPFLTDVDHYLHPLEGIGLGGSLPFQDLIYPGFLLVLLALAAPIVARGRRRWAGLFLVLGLFFALLALGPKLYFQDHLILGPHGRAILLPWYFLVVGKPVLGGMSLPHRMAIPSGLFLSLAAGLSLAALQTRVGGRRGLGAVAALGALVFGEMLFYPGYEIPLSRTLLRTPSYTKVLKESKVDGAVLNLPINLYSNSMRVLFWEQTRHGRPTAQSFRIGQWPSIVAEIPLLYGPIRALTVQGPPLVKKRPPDPGDPLGVARLTQAGFAYVVLHAGWVDLQRTKDLSVWRDTLEGALGPGLPYRDGSVIFPLTPEARAEALRAEALLDPWQRLPPDSRWELLLGQEGFHPVGTPPESRPPQSAPPPDAPPSAETWTLPGGSAPPTPTAPVDPGGPRG